MRDNNMVNAMAWKWPRIKTWTFSDKKRTWIDHTLVSKTLIQNGTITKAGVETGHSFYTSDHNLCAVNLNITKMIGKNIKSDVHNRHTSTHAEEHGQTIRKMLRGRN